MRLIHVALLGILVTGLSLSGCTSPEPVTPDDEGPTYDEESYTLEAEGVPTNAEANVTFNFTLKVMGDEQGFSDHIGAHYGTNSTDEPSTDVYAMMCLHQAGDLPGDFTVECTIEDEGTYYLRGHTRVTTDSGQLNYWTDEEFTIIVGPEIG